MQKWEPAWSTNSLASFGFKKPSRISSLSGFIGLQQAQPDQLTLWLHRASTIPAGSTHSLASSGFNQPSRTNSLSGFIGLQPAQQDQLTLWLHLA
jgi:hypothetical protein